jgi:hypothetical protein
VALILAGYFDESIRTEGGEPICVGGYLFKPSGYARFCERWRREVLRLPDRRQLPHFHMTDLCSGWGVYKGLGIPERVDILDRAIAVIEAHSYASIAVQFDQAEFAQLAPAEWPQYRGSIYTSACHMCLQLSGFWLREWGSHLDVLYVFERGHKFQAEAEDALRAIAANPDASNHFRYRNHRFEDKAREPGLQAADLWSWTVTKTVVNIGHKTPQALKPFLPALFRLAHVNVDRQKISMFTGEKLRRYIYEQLVRAEEHGIPVMFRNRKPAFK